MTAETRRSIAGGVRQLAKLPEWKQLQIPAHGAVWQAILHDSHAWRMHRSLVCANSPVTTLSPQTTSNDLAGAAIFSHRFGENAPVGVLRVLDLFGVDLPKFGLDRPQRPESNANAMDGVEWFRLGRRAAAWFIEEPLLAADPIEGVSAPSRSGALLRTLWRLEEMTRDRYGMLACQDPAIARVSIADEYEIGDEDLNVIPEITPSEALVSSCVFEFGLLRMAAISQFARSDRFQSFFETALGEGNGGSGAVSSGFLVGECVEVHLDGRWLPGTVERVSADGDLFIRLEGETKAWHFSIHADMVRKSESTREKSHFLGLTAA